MTDANDAPGDAALPARDARGAWRAGGLRRRPASHGAGADDDQRRQAADRERRSRSTSGSRRVLRGPGASRSRRNAAERQRHRARAGQRRRRHRLHRLGAGDDRPHAGHRFSCVAASEDEGTSTPTTGRTSWSRARARSDPADSPARRSPSTPSRASARSTIKAALKKLGGGSELDQAPGAAVPGDADGAEQRSGRRDLGAGAVRDPGADPRRRADRDGAGAGLGSYWPNGDTAPRRAGRGEPGARQGVPTAMNQSLEYAQAHPDEIRALLPAGRRTSGCRSGAPCSTWTS